MPSNDEEKLATENLCKIEYKVIFVTHLIVMATGFLLTHCLALFTEYHLPFDSYLIFLPPHELWSAWVINYLFWTVTEWFTTIFFSCYVCVPLLLMSQSCWLLDMIVKTADKMNANLHSDEDMSDLDRNDMTNNSLKKIIARCLAFLKWRDDVQELLQWNFNLEFQVQSLILCLSIYVLSFTSTGAQIVAVVIIVALFQLYGFCWMGSRVTTRIHSLTFEVSKNFYLMRPSQRKVLLSIVHWTQSMKGFSGLFSDVSLVTFKEV